MRPVLHSDLRAAARALLAITNSQRVGVLAQMIDHAETADRYMRRLGKPHAEWGTGTLASAARKRCLAPEPTMDSSEYCACLGIVLRGLIERRAKL